MIFRTIQFQIQTTPDELPWYKQVEPTMTLDKLLSKLYLLSWISFKVHNSLYWWFWRVICLTVLLIFYPPTYFCGYHRNSIALFSVSKFYLFLELTEEFSRIYKTHGESLNIKKYAMRSSLREAATPQNSNQPQQQSPQQSSSQQLRQGQNRKFLIAILCSYKI